MALTCPKYSFVQDGSGTNLNYADCYPDVQPCLPTSSSHNLAFQVTILVLGEDMDGFMSVLLGTGINYIAAVPVDFECNPEFSPITPLNHLVLITPGEYETQVDGPNYLVTMWFNTWNNDYSTATDSNNVMALPVGTCFKFAVISEQYTEERLTKRIYYGCTNCFVIVPEDQCYMSVLSYSNATDALGFDYEDGPDGYQNIIELPMYLAKPTMTDDSKAYTRSDGTIMKIYERKEEVYELETDQMPYTWLKALDVALSHDTVNIVNPNLASFDPINTANQFIKKDNFEIEYNPAPFSALGKGKCKLANADALNLINNNCS